MSMLAARTEIPLVDLQAQYETIASEVVRAIQRVVERQVFVNGPEIEAFETEFAAACESEECVAVSNGTTALELALEALGVGPGDEVITVSHTFIATAGAIARTGATPVFVDIDEDSWTMSPSLVAEALTPWTKAIVPVHIYGHPADVPAIAAAAPGIPIVEDAAQAHLARYHGCAVGSASLAACYSFYPGKNLGAYGDAGAVVTGDAGFASTLRSLRDHGRMPGGKYDHQRFGTNARMADIQAAVLRAKLPHLSGWTSDRNRFAMLYEDALRKEDLRLQLLQPWAEHARHLFVLLHPERDAIVAQLNDRAIGAGIHYPIPVHLQAAMTHPWRTTEAGLGTTERVARDCLSLPLYPELGEDGVATVVDALDAVLHTAA